MKIFLSHMSVFPRGLNFLVKAAKDVGYDGIEVFNFNFSQRKIGKITKLAKKTGLGLHFHQVWPYEDDSTAINWILDKLGFLPPPALDAKTQSENIMEPVVVYPDEWRQASRRSNFWLQTNLSHGPKGMKMTLDDFTRVVEGYGLPVVFDTQHYLEDCVGTNGVEFISSDKRLIMGLLEDGWARLGPYVKEIHLCDFDPELGNQKGRNLFLGEGVFPLKEFAKMIKATGWNGTIVPEVKPQHIFSLWKITTFERLARLKKIVKNLFE